MLFTTCSRLGLGWLCKPSGAFGVGADGIPFHFLISSVLETLFHSLTLRKQHAISTTSRFGAGSDYMVCDMFVRGGRTCIGIANLNAVY